MKYPEGRPEKTEAEVSKDESPANQERETGRTYTYRRQITRGRRSSRYQEQQNSVDSREEVVTSPEEDRNHSIRTKSSDRTSSYCTRLGRRFGSSTKRIAMKKQNTGAWRRFDRTRHWQRVCPSGPRRPDWLFRPHCAMAWVILSGTGTYLLNIDDGRVEEKVFPGGSSRAGRMGPEVYVELLARYGWRHKHDG